MTPMVWAGLGGILVGFVLGWLSGAGYVTERHERDLISPDTLRHISRREGQRGWVQ
jgi:hypothetical protein